MNGYRIKHGHIPEAVLRQIEEPAHVGGRHAQIVKISTWLVAQEYDPNAIFEALRVRYPFDGVNAVPDDEIRNIIESACNYFRQGGRTIRNTRLTKKLVRPHISQGVTLHIVETLLKGRRYTEADLIEQSPVKLRDHPVEGTIRFLLSLFRQHDLINIVPTFQITADGKAVPSGYGKTRHRGYWNCSFFDNYRLPGDQAGCWIRLNPVDGEGISNKNVTAFRYALFEFDVIPQELQLSLLATVKLPIAAIVKSGGKSLHAWVHIDAPDAQAYGDAVQELFELAAPLGVDVANKNPSRLARLPGAIRTIGATGDGLQKLLYLNPNPKAEAIIDA